MRIYHRGTGNAHDFNKKARAKLCIFLITNHSISNAIEI